MDKRMTGSTSPEAHWRDALRDGRFLLQRSLSSGAFIFPPRVMAPGTGSDDLEWVEACGRGTVYSVTMISPKPPAEPYNVVLVDLAEGPRVMSRVEGLAPDSVQIGMAVQARISKDGDQAVLLFDPA
jgi:uncharacterized protein